MDGPKNVSLLDKDEIRREVSAIGSIGQNYSSNRATNKFGHAFVGAGVATAIDFVSDQIFCEMKLQMWHIFERSLRSAGCNPPESLQMTRKPFKQFTRRNGSRAARTGRNKPKRPARRKSEQRRNADRCFWRSEGGPKTGRRCGMTQICNSGLL